jgi:hypothetical protein
MKIHMRKKIANKMTYQGGRLSLRFPSLAMWMTVRTLVHGDMLTDCLTVLLHLYTHSNAQSANSGLLSG